MLMFRPKIGLTLLLFFLALVFSGLGYWQLQRKAEKENLFDQYENAPLMDLSAAASEGNGSPGWKATAALTRNDTSFWTTALSMAVPVCTY